MAFAAAAEIPDGREDQRRSCAHRHVHIVTGPIVPVHIWDFSDNTRFTDTDLCSLAEQLSSSAPVVILNLRVNMLFTDVGLSKLAEKFPSTATEVTLNFFANRNFTDDRMCKQPGRLAIQPTLMPS